MNQGTIVQCIGAVVDVEFARSEMPKIYDALKMDEIGLTLEVQQQLGDGVVRTIALGSSDGLRRGMTVVNTGNPIMVPVGPATIGRIMDVLGNPIDERGPVAQDLVASIHRKPPAYDGHHIQIYVADFAGPHRRLGERGLVTEESDQHQYRFADIVDLASGKALFTIEHEVRSMRHPLYARPLVNRNPEQTNRAYMPGRDAYVWALPDPR